MRVFMSIIASEIQVDVPEHLKDVVKKLDFRRETVRSGDTCALDLTRA